MDCGDTTGKCKDDVDGVGGSNAQKQADPLAGKTIVFEPCPCPECKDIRDRGSVSLTHDIARIVPEKITKNELYPFEIEPITHEYNHGDERFGKIRPKAYSFDIPNKFQPDGTGFVKDVIWNDETEGFGKNKIKMPDFTDEKYSHLLDGIDLSKYKNILDPETPVAEPKEISKTIHLEGMDCNCDACRKKKTSMFLGNWETRYNRDFNGSISRQPKEEDLGEYVRILQDRKKKGKL